MKLVTTLYLLFQLADTSERVLEIRWGPALWIQNQWWVKSLGSEPAGKESLPVFAFYLFIYFFSNGR